jgi:hypothetical protein
VCQINLGINSFTGLTVLSEKERHLSKQEKDYTQTPQFTINGRLVRFLRTNGTLPKVLKTRTIPNLTRWGVPAVASASIARAVEDWI